MRSSVGRVLVLGSVAALAVAPIGCGGSDGGESSGSSPGASSTSSLEIGNVPLGESLSIDGLTFRAPDAWTRRASGSTMRAAQFELPAVGGEEPGQIVLYFFGEGQGGSARANLDRWVGQFEAADGSSAHDLARTEDLQVGPLSVSTVSVVGTMLPARMPGSQETAKKPGWRMLGAVVEGPGGPWFWKATGPRAVIDRAEPGFRALLASMAPASS